MRCVAFMLLFAAALSAAANAQTADTVDETVRDAQQTRLQTQEAQDEWAAERARLHQRWKAAAAQIEYLQRRVDLERARVSAIEAATEEFARRLEESARLEASLEDTLLSILDRLAISIDHSVPFLPDERSMRMLDVRDELVDPNTSAADKLRRVLEAVLVEARYGAMLESYQDRIEVEGTELTCDMLMIGRLALYWLTPDTSRGGAWDPARKAFVVMEGDDLESIRRAMEMATRQRPLGVQTLPLGKVGS